MLHQGAPELAAVFTLTADGEISGEARNGHEELLRNVLEDHLVLGLGGRIYDRDVDPKGWFAALPWQYHGTHLWAVASSEEV